MFTCTGRGAGQQVLIYAASSAKSRQIIFRELINTKQVLLNNKYFLIV